MGWEGWEGDVSKDAKWKMPHPGSSYTTPSGPQPGMKGHNSGKLTPNFCGSGVCLSEYSLLYRRSQDTAKLGREREGRRQSLGPNLTVEGGCEVAEEGKVTRWRTRCRCARG